MKGVKVLCIFIFFLANFSQAQKSPLVKKGVLDLSSRNWSVNGVCDLNGEWEFYWKRLYDPSYFKGNNNPEAPAYIKVPGFWNDGILPKEGYDKYGYATYRLRVICPPQSNALALKILTISTAYKLFVNGRELLNVGNVSVTPANHVPAYKPAVVHAEPDNNHELEIIVQVSNYSYRVSGIWDFIKIGTAEQIFHYRVLNTGWYFFVEGIFFAIGLYHIIIFFFYRERYSFLYLGALCLFVTVRVLFSGEFTSYLLLDVPWALTVRLEYLSLYLIMPLAVLFAYTLFYQIYSKKILTIFLGMDAILVTIVLVTPPSFFTYTLRSFEMLTLVAATHAIYVSFKARKSRWNESIFFLSGFFILLVTIINDILYTSLIIESIHLFYVGMFAFVIFQAFSLSKKFSLIFNRYQVNNKQLSRMNEQLSESNKAIIKKSDELGKLNRELDEIVYRTTHDLRSPLTSILGILHLMRMETDFSGMQEYYDLQEKTIHRMDELIKDIIDYSKNKRLDIEVKEIGFKSIVDHALEDHAYIENAMSVEKRVDISQHEKFYSDLTRIKVIINNLISNGIKYADVSKLNCFLSIKILVENSKATIEVEDNGIGIDETHLEKIFTMFYRATSSSTGSGLGLYILKEAIDKLNGNITIQSKKGEGTLIKVIIAGMKQ